MKKIKVGSIVKTIKGDRLNKKSKDELLKVEWFGTSRQVGGNYERTVICSRKIGRKGTFLLKNLILIK